MGATDQRNLVSEVSKSFSQVVAAAKGLVAGIENRIEQIPQAVTEEHNLQASDGRDWRSYFASKLSGRGLEIGPLHRPMVTHEGMQVEYIDRMTVQELREHYPELRELPLVEPDLIGNAETMEGVRDAGYDFLISAHVIEHMKNPLASLEQWCRIVKPGGKIYLIVPDKRRTFDRKRLRTTLEHIVLDYRRPSNERDYEHFLDQAIHVNDQSGQAAIDFADEWVRTDYSIHFHTFIPTDMLRLLRWFAQNVRPLKIVEGPCQAPGSDEFHFLLEVR